MILARMALKAGLLATEYSRRVGGNNFGGLLLTINEH